jgi:hypothetical protein
MSIVTRIKALEQALADLHADREREKDWKHELEQLRKAQHVDHSIPLPRWGVDYAWKHPDAGKLRASGATFAVRYLGGTGAGKDLTHLEAEDLSHHGLDIALVYEDTAGRAGEGYDAGAQDAHRAAGEAKRAGQPTTRPIYLACDFDAAGEGKTGPVLEYIRGAVHAIGWDRVGLYAGLDVIEQAVREHRCKFLWQTLAWSHGKWSPHAQLRQVENGRIVAGAEVDIDKAVAADFGQWRV